MPWDLGFVPAFVLGVSPTVPHPGSIIFRQLQSALDDARGTVLRVKQGLELLDGQMSELVARKGASLLELARYYLPEISRSSIESTFVEIQSSLLEVLGHKERTRAELTTRMSRFVETCAKLEQQLADVTAQLNELVRKREAIEEVVGEQLKQDVEFQRLTREAALAEEVLQKNESRVKELQRSAKEKLPPYQRSSLFRYLLRRKYGTVEYTERGWTRHWDKWVADLIDFPRAKIGYEFLTTTPGLMAKEVARRQTEFRLLMQQVEAIEDRYNDAAGLTAVREVGLKLGSRRDECVAALEATRHEQRRVEDELRQLDQAQDRFYTEALQKFEQFLEQTETGVLQSRAQRTTDPRDDEIVGRITELSRQIEGLKPRIAQAALDRKLADDLASGAELVVSRFRQNNFDSERSSFSPALDVTSELARYRDGLLKPEELWQTIRRQQQFEPTQAEVIATGAAHTMAQVLSDPVMSRVLVNAMVTVAGTALDALAQSSVERRAPERHQQQMDLGRPPTGGGFTSGDGF